jgi:hypothetical protein
VSYIFTYGVNMSTMTEKVLPLYEKVIHIAFGCGCVRTFLPHQMTAQQCPVHGDRMISSTEEFQKKSGHPHQPCLC